MSRCVNPWLSAKDRSVISPEPANHSAGKKNFQKNVKTEESLRGIFVVRPVEFRYQTDQWRRFRKRPFFKKHGDRMHLQADACTDWAAALFCFR